MSGNAWITGAGGLLGHQLTMEAAQRRLPWNIVGLTHPALNLTDFAAVEHRFREDKPNLVIHCAAMSRSPDCQANPALARKINVEITAFLDGLAYDIPFIFLSSDQVFDGRKGNYIETDALNPLNIYGETKAAAEQILSRNSRHTIVRLALCGGASPKSRGPFNEELQALWRDGKTAKLFFDEFRSPIAAPVAARALWEIARQSAAGIFHLGGSKRLSRVEIGQMVAARHLEWETRIEAASQKDFPGGPRAADVSLRCDKLQRLLPFPLPALDEWLTANPQEPF